MTGDTFTTKTGRSYHVTVKRGSGAQWYPETFAEICEELDSLPIRTVRMRWPMWSICEFN